ncbi:MAG: DUF2497 domain-containing protein, partial [Novosphingobium sp.]
NRAITAGLGPQSDADVTDEASGASDDPSTVLDLADSDLAEPAGEEAAPLAAESTHGAVRGSLENLVLAAEAGPPADAAAQTPHGDAPFEALVREMLRPALAEWLDRNLPPMVERLVAVEIARIVGKRG